MNHRIQRTFGKSFGGVGAVTADKFASLGLSSLSWLALLGGGLIVTVGSSIIWPLSIPIGLVSMAGGAYGLYDVASSGEDIGAGIAALFLVGGLLWVGGGGIWYMVNK